MEANIAKLRARYPEKYSDEAAAKRDLEAEADAMARAMEEEALSRGGSLTYGVADLAGAAHFPTCDCTACIEKIVHPSNCSCTSCRQRRLHPESF
jgi:hypothetical protein